MKNRYIVMTNGRWKNEYETPEGIVIPGSSYPHNEEALTMDVKSPHGRRPMSLISAKQRVTQIVQNEKGVKAFICKVEYVAMERPSPVIIQKVTDVE